MICIISGQLARIKVGARALRVACRSIVMREDVEPALVRGSGVAGYRAAGSVQVDDWRDGAFVIRKGVRVYRWSPTTGDLTGYSVGICAAGVRVSVTI